MIKHLLNQFWWLHHWAVMLSCWPQLSPSCVAKEPTSWCSCSQCCGLSSFSSFDIMDVWTWHTICSSCFHSNPFFFCLCWCDTFFSYYSCILYEYWYLVLLSFHNTGHSFVPNKNYCYCLLLPVILHYCSCISAAVLWPLLVDLFGLLLTKKPSMGGSIDIFWNHTLEEKSYLWFFYYYYY